VGKGWGVLVLRELTTHLSENQIFKNKEQKQQQQQKIDTNIGLLKISILIIQQ
jgi:hypothetical protein